MRARSLEDRGHLWGGQWQPWRRGPARTEMSLGQRKEQGLPRPGGKAAVRPGHQGLALGSLERSEGD